MSIDVLIFTFFECFFLAELCSLWKDCFCFVKRQQQQKKAKKMPYFTAEGRQNLKKYKYHGVDKSLLANHIGQPFWRAAVNWLPMSLAFVFSFLFVFVFVFFGFGFVDVFDLIFALFLLFLGFPFFVYPFLQARQKKN